MPKRINKCAAQKWAEQSRLGLNQNAHSLFSAQTIAKTCDFSSFLR